MRDPRRGSLRASYPVRPGRPLGVEPPPPLRLTQTTGASAGASLGSEGAAGSATWSRVDRGRIRRPRCAHGLDQVHCTCARERKGDLRPHRCSTSGLASVVIAPGCPRLPVPNAHEHLGTWTHDTSARRTRSRDCGVGDESVWREKNRPSKDLLGTRGGGCSPRRGGRCLDAWPKIRSPHEWRCAVISATPALRPPGG